MLRRLYCYGTLGMTREWLLRDNITPAVTVVEMMFQSMPQSLRSIYFGEGAKEGSEEGPP